MYEVRIMKKIEIVIALAVALFTVPAMAQNTIIGSDSVDILLQGIFEAEGSIAKIPIGESANLDSLIVGDDRALAFGNTWGFSSAKANAMNNLDITKSQQAGNTLVDLAGFQYNTSPVINAERIKVGNRQALAFGPANAVNNIKITTSQIGGNIETVNSMA
jgi:hypothetical protein